MAEDYCTRYRSIRDPNIFAIIGDNCFITLFDVSGDYRGTAVIDKCFYDICKRHKWYKTDTGYTATKINGKTIMMHWIVTGEKYIDHANGAKCDNRFSNLRVCTVSQNLHNRPSQRNGKSKYKGVWKYPRNKKNPWCAAITYNGKRVWCGCHKTESEAAIAYNKKAKKLVGEFARLNEVE